MEDFLALYQELICRDLGKYILRHLDSAQLHYERVVETKAYNALYEIRQVIRDETFNDFEAIEAIIRIFDAYDLDADFRQDFG